MENDSSINDHDSSNSSGYEDMPELMDSFTRLIVEEEEEDANAAPVKDAENYLLGLQKELVGGSNPNFLPATVIDTPPSTSFKTSRQTNIQTRSTTPRTSRGIQHAATQYAIEQALGEALPDFNSDDFVDEYRDQRDQEDLAKKNKKRSLASALGIGVGLTSLFVNGAAIAFLVVFTTISPLSYVSLVAQGIGCLVALVVVKRHVFDMGPTDSKYRHSFLCF